MGNSYSSYLKTPGEGSLVVDPQSADVSVSSAAPEGTSCSTSKESPAAAIATSLAQHLGTGPGPRLEAPIKPSLSPLELTKEAVAKPEPRQHRANF